MNKKTALWAILAGGTGIIIAYLAYKGFNGRRMNKELQRVGQIMKDKDGRIKKDQAALLSGIVLRFSSEKVSKVKLLEERLKCLPNKEQYVDAVLKALNKEHGKYNETLHDICRRLNIPALLLINSSDYYIKTKDIEYAQLLSKYTAESVQCKAKVSLVEAQKIYETMSTLSKETFTDYSLQSAAEKVAQEHKIDPIEFIEAVSKTLVYDLLYQEYQLTEEQIEASFTEHKLAPNFHNNNNIS